MVVASLVSLQLYEIQGLKFETRVRLQVRHISRTDEQFNNLPVLAEGMQYAYERTDP